MFIKRTVAKHGDKTYINYLLVESISTPKGSRHKVICNLGHLAPGPREEWLELAERIQAALSGQPSLFPDPRVDEAVRRAREHQARQATTPPNSAQPESQIVPEVVAIKPTGVEIQNLREVGALHVGHQIWLQLHFNEILKTAGLNQSARVLTEVMTLNRLIWPCSELAMVEWARRTAVSDILGQDVSKLDEDQLYRNLDKIHGKRSVIESELYARERSLFNLQGTLVLYDVTNTYFEGKMLQTPKAKRGHSNICVANRTTREAWSPRRGEAEGRITEKRTDCKLVAMGLMLDGDGFPIGHEIHAGNTHDRKTVEGMLKALEARTGQKGGATVVMDRGMASEDNLNLLRTQHYDYLVAGIQNQRAHFMDDFEAQEGWIEIHPHSITVPISIKRIEKDDFVVLLCVSPARAEKDRAIREKQEKRLLADLEKLSLQVQKTEKAGKAIPDAVLYEKIGRLRERYQRVGRYYEIGRENGQLIWSVRAEKKQRAEELDGAYFLKTSRMDMSPKEIWRTYVTLTRIEASFRDLKGALDMRPVYHRKEMRVETHIFLPSIANNAVVCSRSRCSRRWVLPSIANNAVVCSRSRCSRRWVPYHGLSSPDGH